MSKSQKGVTGFGVAVDCGPNPKAWYEVEQVTGLLDTVKGATVCKPLVFGVDRRAMKDQDEAQELSALESQNVNDSIAAALTSKTPTMMVVSSKESHWTGGIMVPGKDKDTKPQFFYNDSLGGEMPEELTKSLEDKGVEIVDLKTRQQENGYDCGPWTVNNLKTLLEVVGDKGVIDVQEEMKRRLSESAKDNNAAKIRLDHATNHQDLFGGQESAKELESALLERMQKEEEEKKKQQQSGVAPSNQPDVGGSNPTKGKPVFNDSLQEALGNDFEDKVSRRKPGNAIGSISCNSDDEAKEVVKKMEQFCKDIGLPCKVKHEGNTYKVGITMPEGFKGNDPFSMDKDELEDLRNAVAAQEQEKEAAQKKLDAEGKQTEEGPKENAVLRGIRSFVTAVRNVFSKDDENAVQENQTPKDAQSNVAADGPALEEVALGDNKEAKKQAGLVMEGLKNSSSVMDFGDEDRDQREAPPITPARAVDATKNNDPQQR